jgi:hypothetical protein
MLDFHAASLAQAGWQAGKLASWLERNVIAPCTLLVASMFIVSLSLPNSSKTFWPIASWPASQFAWAR